MKNGFKGTKNKLVVISDFEYFRIDEKLHGNQLKRLARVIKSGYSVNEANANAVLFSRSYDLLQALEHTLEVLYKCDCPKELHEEYGNLFMNYNNLINEIKS